MSSAPAAKKTAAAAAPPARRGPGRPPRAQPTPPLDHLGVVDSPNNPNNRLEFVYSDPISFRALFSYLKNIKAVEIFLRCNKTGLTFFARDHSETSRAIGRFAGEHVNWYYCDGEFRLDIKREEVEKMFYAISKSFFKVTITQSNDDHSSLYFIFKDADIEMDNTYRITLSSHKDDPNLFQAETLLAPEKMLELFPIEFTLSAKKFKEIIGNISNYSDVFSIEKIGDEPLQFVYTRSNVNYHGVLRSAEKIHLRSNIPKGTTFCCHIKVDNVKSLAASLVTENVRILIRENDDILFCSALDTKALTVSTLTKII
ncbi:MAG: hypothetical protein WC700_10070 [Gemmatimonadaceae bacterium]|jgi:hypothetical protein